MPNNREPAPAILLSLLLAFALFKPDMRQSLSGIFSAFFNHKIIISLLLFIMWMVAWIWLAERLDLWSSSLLADTVLWVAISAVSLLFNADRVAQDRHFFSGVLRSAVTVSAVMNFFLTIRAFSLEVELVIHPIVALLAMMQLFAGSDKQYAPTKKALDAIVAIVGMALAGGTIAQLIRYFDTLDPAEISRSFAMTIWLPAVALPFVFVFCLFIEYELAFMRMEYAGTKGAPRWEARLAVLLGLNIHYRDIHCFAGGWAAGVESAPTFSAALHRVRGFRQTRRVQELSELERLRRLKRYAGIEGVDKEGKRLDRREFAETQSALSWLATCHMGWYRNHGERYQTDLLERLGGFPAHGLPEEHGIVMEVRGDGQAWYAWRRTVSGWVFAIGAAAKPPDQWLYDAAEPPMCFPSTDAGWDHYAPGSEASNWS